MSSKLSEMIEDFGDEIFLRTMAEVIIPNMRDNAILAKEAVIQEVDSQDLIDTGRFRASIQSSANLSNFDAMTIEVWSDAKSVEGYPYPLALEYGTSKMHARAPFRKSIARIERTFRG